MTTDLDPLVTQEVKIPLGRMIDALVHHSASQGIPVLEIFVVVSWEKPKIYELRLQTILKKGFIISDLVWCLFWTTM